MREPKSFVRRMKSLRALSPLIATLLLTAVAIAASIVTYSFVMAMISSQSQQSQTRIRIDTVTWNISGNNCTVVIRNMGSINATIASIAISYLSSDSTFYQNSFDNVISTGTTLSLTWSESSASVPSNFITTLTEYVVRVTTSTGFQYEIVSTSPSA